MKPILRNRNKALLLSLLTSMNQNNYHSKLTANLISIIKNLPFKNTKQCLTIGSYINKPGTEIIPPHLPTYASTSKLTPISEYSYSYPVFSKDNREMQFYSHKPNLKYENKCFDIKILRDLEKTVNVKNNDIVMLPLLAFTKQKYRLGKGGGYYDTYIRHSRETSSRTVFVGVGFQALRVQGHGIIDSWDEALDFVITQQNIY